MPESELTANQPAKTNSVSNMIRLLVWVLALLYVASRLIPCHSITDYALVVPVDSAWTQALHVAFTEHLQFGRDLVFTYGPWGFLARGYYPPTYLISVSAWVILSMIFLCAGWRLARHFSSNYLIAWLWLIAFTAISTIPSGNDFNGRLTAWGLLLLSLHFAVENKAFSILQSLLVFTLSWLGLIKFTGMMEGGLLVTIISANTILTHRRFPWMIPLWLTGIVFFWVLAGQHLNLLGQFLRNSWETTNGYTDAMMSPDAAAERRSCFYLLIGITSCVLVGAAIWSQRRLNGIFCGAGIGGILFLSFKLGYVRADSHEAAAGMTLLLMALITIAVPSVQKKYLQLASAVLLVISILFAATTFGSYDNYSFYRQLAGTFSPYNLLSPVASLTTNRLRDEYEKSAAQLRDGIPLPSIQGSSDLYSYYQDVLFAHGLDYRPRPIIQSYSAYTPRLARMNADWLKTDHAAANIFFAVQTIDDRFPSLDDGLSWPELLTRYDVKGLANQQGTYLVLARTPLPRKYDLAPLPAITASFGQPFTLPANTNGLIWAEIEIDKTSLGKLASFFYKPETLMANVELADKSKYLCRIVPGITSAGFLISPYIANNRSFAALAEADESVLTNKTVVSMTIFDEEHPNDSRCYQSQMKIRFYRLNLPAQKIAIQAPEIPSKDLPVQ